MTNEEKLQFENTMLHGVIYAIREIIWSGVDTTGPWNSTTVERIAQVLITNGLGVNGNEHDSLPN